MMSIDHNLAPEQLWQYKVSCRLKVGSAYGTEFQDFFSTVMERSHGADFVHIRAFGSLGDKGCDGYLQSCGRVFQCYGKMADAATNVATLTAKIENDFALAGGHLTSLMKEWHFGHNLVNGLPTEAILTIEKMKGANPTKKIGLIGPSSLEDIILKLPPLDLLELLGPAATAADTRNLQMAEVGSLIENVIAGVDAAEANLDEIKQVPADKLEFNKIPPHWDGLIRSGVPNARYVSHFLRHYHDPEAGIRIAAAFNARYRALRLEGLEPGDIMDRLYEAVTGVGSVTAQRQVAAHALLAYMFESCDIFERLPEVMSA